MNGRAMGHQVAALDEGQILAVFGFVHVVDGYNLNLAINFCREINRAGWGIFQCQRHDVEQVAFRP